MTRRKKREQEDSFGLFLDAITNTFGVVLLIALIIVLLIKSPAVDAGDVRSKSAAAVIADLQSCESQIANLKFEVATQREVLDENSDETTRSLLKKIEHLGSQSQDLKRVVEDYEKGLKTLNEAMESHLQNSKSIDASMNAMQLAIEALNKQIASADKRTSRSLPLLRSDSRPSQIPVFVDDDRVYFIFNTGFSGVNDNHFKRVYSSSLADFERGGRYYAIRKGSGVPVASFSSVLNKYRSSYDYFAFVVRTNSFKNFHVLQKQLADADFRHQVFPTDASKSLGAGGGSAKTQ